MSKFCKMPYIISISLDKFERYPNTFNFLRNLHIEGIVEFKDSTICYTLNKLGIDPRVLQYLSEVLTMIEAPINIYWDIVHIFYDLQTIYSNDTKSMIEFNEASIRSANYRLMKKPFIMNIKPVERAILDIHYPEVLKELKFLTTPEVGYLKCDFNYDLDSFPEYLKKIILPYNLGIGAVKMMKMILKNSGFSSICEKLPEGLRPFHDFSLFNELTFWTFTDFYKSKDEIMEVPLDVLPPAAPLKRCG